MTSIGDALPRLQDALVEAGHPLASARPIGRSLDDLEESARQLLGRPLPNEFAALWQWWGGEEFWPPDTQRPAAFADQLPGGVTVLSLEHAQQRKQALTIDGLLGPAQADLLPFAYIGDGVEFLWSDTSNDLDSPMPVSLHDMGEPPPDPPICTFPSVASWVNAMARMLETGRWRHDEHLGWNYPGPQPIWVTEANEA